MAIDEKGIVTGIRGDFLTLRVTRDTFTGGGCCGASGSETIQVEAVNECGARVGDLVNLDGRIELEAGYQTLRIGAYTAAFTAGLIAGEFTALPLGLAAVKTGYALALGLICALAAFFLVKLIRGKTPPPLPRAIRIITSARS
jgi:hypothetical protein